MRIVVRFLAVGKSNSRSVEDCLSRIDAILDVLENLMEVTEDVRGYARDWDWKYGEEWDEEIGRAKEFLKKERGKE